MPGLAESKRRVIFHADDFGMNHSVNQGILTAFRDGLLTSTSLLSNAQSAEAACREWPQLISHQLAEKLPSSDSRRALQDPALPFDLGVHLNLTQGRPLTDEKFSPDLLDEQGHFPGITKLFFRLRKPRFDQLSSVRRELESQIEFLCDHGQRPSHLNGHQYVELVPHVAAMIPELLRRYSIPVVRVAQESSLERSLLLKGRLLAWGLGRVKHHFAKSFRHRMQKEGFAFADRFFGTSHAGQIDLKIMTQFLNTNSRSGVTEIGIHPAMALTDMELPRSDPWYDPLHALRPAELNCLCDIRLRNLLRDSKWMLGRTQLLGYGLHR